MRINFIIGCFFVMTAGTFVGATETIQIKIQGSTTVNPIVTEAAEIFRDQKGWRILVDTQGGSSAGISAIGEGLIDIGMISKPVSDEDRKRYPHVDFEPVAIGIDGVALIVSKAIWESGLKTITREQMQAIYEKRVRNWQDLGAKKSPIVFYNKEPGRGTWEVFANWAYGSYKKTPYVSHPEVGSNEETRHKVSFHPSAMSQLSFAWIEGAEKIKALGIQLESGETIQANLSGIRNGRYPLARKLYVVTDGKPQNFIKEFIDFLTSDQGQKLVEKHGYISIH